MSDFRPKNEMGSGMTMGMIKIANAARKQFLNAIKGKRVVTHTTKGRKWAPKGK